VRFGHAETKRRRQKSGAALRDDESLKKMLRAIRE
jgi:hypothetical protein